MRKIICGFIPHLIVFIYLFVYTLCYSGSLWTIFKDEVSLLLTFYFMVTPHDILDFICCWKVVKVLWYCLLSHFILQEAQFTGFTNDKCEMLLNPGLKSMKLQELWSVEKGCEIVARSRAADVVAVCDVFVCPLWVFWTWLAIQCLA